MADNVENNIHSIAADTGAAADELTTAAEYQRRAGKRAACLMLILVVVVCVVLLAVRPFVFRGLPMGYVLRADAFTRPYS